MNDKGADTGGGQIGDKPDRCAEGQGDGAENYLF